MENSLFVQFYNHDIKRKKYDLLNGFSDTWDFCKSKGEIVWVPYNEETARADELYIPFSEGTIYVSCLFLNAIDVVYNWAEKHPNIKFIIGGPAVIYNEIIETHNVKIYKGTIEEYFGIDNFSYKWKIEIPNELKNDDTIKFLRYNYKIKTGCYWGKCTFCRNHIDYYMRNRPNNCYKNRFNKKTKALVENIVLGNPSITPEEIKWISSIELDKGITLKAYIRPDEISYEACKKYFPKMKHKDKIYFVTAPEFLSQRMLDFVDKGTTIEIIIKFIKLFDKHDIKYKLNFITGWPQLIEEDINELRENIKKIRHDISINLFCLVVSKDYSILSSKYPPPDDQPKWMPIVNCSNEVIDLNFKMIRIIENHFNGFVEYQNFHRKFFDDMLLERRMKYKKGSIQSYEGYDKYCSSKRNLSIEEMFGDNTFYYRRNNVIIDMLRKINKPKIFEFAATYGFLASQISKEINFNKYTTSNFLPEVIEKMKDQVPYEIEVIEFDANDIIGSDLREYNTFICTSLEHLEHDIDIIKALPSKCNFLFSLPNFMDVTHFRIFENEEQIIDRYGNILDIEKIEIIEEGTLKKFVVKSTKKI
jgi:hypothetical protein